jgi:hypothetical protein
VKLGKNASDTHAMLSKAYGGEAMKKSSTSEWHKQFKEGCKNMENDERSGCPRFHTTDENFEKVQNLVQSDRRLSIRAIPGQLNLDMETVKQASTLVQQLDSPP